MVKTLEQTSKDESKRCKVPTNIRPYSIGYRVVSKNGNILTLENGASVFSLEVNYLGEANGNIPDSIILILICGYITWLLR